MALKKREDIRIEYPSRGATYRRDQYGVYKYDTYPRHSVLAGQQRRTFLETFETLEEAQAAYPKAVYHEGACGYREPNLSHLPDDSDY